MTRYNKETTKAMDNAKEGKNLEGYKTLKELEEEMQGHLDSKRKEVTIILKTKGE